MREILFRGKSKKSERWIYGFYGEKRDTHEQQIIRKNDCCCIIVIPETVGQYTGLTDKNGTKIFEGDIVTVFLKDGTEKGYIRYREAGCRFQFMGDKCIGYNIDNTTDFEVIGNIYDNPELLGGVDK